MTYDLDINVPDGLEPISNFKRRNCSNCLNVVMSNQLSKEATRHRA